MSAWGPTDGAGGAELLDRAIEELRHATFGMYGARLRTRLLDRLGWALSPVHYRLLRVVEASEPLRPTVAELGAALLTDKARASRLIDQVEAAGLARRTVGRLDRRRREVELSDGGRAILAEARRLRLDYLRQALATWGHEDVGALAALLARFNASLRDASADWLSDDRNSSV